ncbi:Putative ribonuclease H protein [Dendrobium catenatum]|uniref:Ribonuclease H protein n=1 Tax=Dendrobium catenatum TaxID=906689 RepID=A0A2I0WRB6_9ASPA|nr:Putative ribonuclease H protein [Dendrobium catenatum]
MFNKFFWGSKVNSKAIHWAAWNKVCGVLDEGGLGCKSLFETALLFSHKLWFSFRAKVSLWARFMNVKYCNNMNPLLCVFKNTDSFTWKRLCNIKWEAENFVQWGLGRGDIFFWQDKWLGDYSIDSYLSTHTLESCKVSSFIMNNVWNVEKLNSCVPNCLVDIIKEIPLQVSCNDSILCSATSNGKFHLGKIWDKVRISYDKNPRFTAIWHSSFPLLILRLFGDV